MNTLFNISSLPQHQEVMFKELLTTYLSQVIKFIAGVIKNNTITKNAKNGVKE